MVLFALSLLLAATDMEHKAPVLTTVDMVSAGRAEILCADAQGWTFDVSASTDAGRDVVKVRLTSSVEKAPPPFGVYFRVRGDGVQNVWTSNFTCDGYHLRPKLWWRGQAHDDAQLAQDAPIAVGFNSTGVSKAAIACSEVFENVRYGLYADDETCDLIGRCEFFTEPVAPRKAYEVRVLFDRRGRVWHEVVREAVAWMERAVDCPADPCANRKRVTDLRLTSGRTAVHSDMLVWSKVESAGISRVRVPMSGHKEIVW